MNKFVCYYRVSTSKQGVHGLGMAAQRNTVARFLNGTQPIGEYAEVESGACKDRPELNKAIVLCRKHRATLVLARLDRLARDAAFVLNLRDSGVEFIACDMPGANRLTVGIMALMAEQERDDISARTKAGLAAARRKGVRLGNPAITKQQAKATAAKQKHARAFAAKMAPIIKQITKAKITTLDGIADCLNARGFKSPRGKLFYPQSVRNLLALL